MFLSKIWFVLVCLGAGVAMTAAFVAPRSASRQLESSEAEGLDRAQYAAEQMLKTDAHRWIDYVAKLGRDATITEALDNATKGSGEAKMIHETVKNRLQALVPSPVEIGIEQLVAVDGKGRVVARLGGRDRDYGELVGGLEVVSDALRGYLSDDVWGSEGKLLRVAGAPVLAKTRDRIVGAVYVAAETGKRLVDIWKKNLGVDVALLLHGQVVSSTVPEGELGTLPDLVAERTNEITEAKRTRAFALPHGSDRMLAVAAPFAGQAADLRAYYVLLGAQTTLSDPLTLLAHTTKDELAWSRFPWIRLVGGILMMLLVGTALQRVEMENPLARLRAEVQKLARGEVQKLQDARHPGKFGGIARDVNASLERFTHAPAVPATETAGKDMNAILGAAPRPGGPPKTFDLPSLAGLSPSGPSSGFGPSPTPSSFGAAPPSTPAFSPLGPPPAPAPLPPPGSVGPIPGARLSSPPLPGAPRPLGPPSAPLSFGGTTPTPVVTPPILASTLGGGAIGAAPALPSAPTAPPFAAPAMPPPAAPKLASVPPPDPTPAPRPTPVMTPAAPALAREMDDEPTSNLSDDDEPKTASVSMDAEEAHMRDVFGEYVTTRQRCGESTVGLTFEKFRTKLDANRQQLVAKYGCRTARFSVYVKDGKAAIKATPVK